MKERHEKSLGKEAKRVQGYNFPISNGIYSPKPSCYNASMIIFDKQVKGCKSLVFLDLEATAFTAEMIELGAHLAILDKDGAIKRKGKPFKRYVLPSHPVGFPVTKLTGITDKFLQKEGKPFKTVLSEFRKYVGKYWDSCRFVTFGEHDITIIKSTMAANRDIDPVYARQIYRRHFDFQQFLAPYVQDQHGNPLSLKNYLTVFGLTFDGLAHDAIDDAKNLMELYQKSRVSPEIFVQEYEKSLQNLNKIAKPLKEAIKMLNEGMDVTPDIWKTLVRESFR